MRILPRFRKKVWLTTALSTCMISSFVTPAYAGATSGPLDNMIGNELPAVFNVTAPDVEDTVILSWDTAALNTALESYDLIQDEAKTITYYVSPGADNDDDLSVTILLKLPETSAAAVDSIEVDDNTIESSFSDNGFDYYELNEGLAIGMNDTAYSDTFDITFNDVSNGTPFSASLVAIKESTPALKTEMPGEGNFWPLSFINGETKTATLYYYPAAGADNGTAVIQLGEGITGFDAATSSYTDYETGTHTDLTNFWDEATKTLTIPISVPANSPRECYITLQNAVFNSTPGTYSVSIKVDSDGAGTAYSESDEYTMDYQINQPS
ncbi:hypothetical protein [Paenibacillus sp. HB172176]|uniref:hypothetical protein n=1 Tax=Paenibacillus sp. HB172176 TaxID=2493690 RepID=UPI00143CA7C3|nr:hypothetical protein [Paenibacillus sp. HB172176]